MVTEELARWERRLRPFLARLPPSLAVRLFSLGRARFAAALCRRPPRASFEPQGLGRTLWGLRFRAPLLNAAGMFKNGEGYELAYRQGAGAYLAGTTTAVPRRGNVGWPFAPYPRSGAASNYLGLPNPGHRAVAERLSGLPRYDGFPIGASVASTFDGAGEEEKLERWVEGMRLYEEAGVDFLEINESCPNTEDDPEEMAGLRARLTYVADEFLKRRGRRLQVLVKLSCDTELSEVGELVALLAELGFDGVNFGNTSTSYQAHRRGIAAPEAGLYDHFTGVFGGGVSGRPLKERSLHLAAAAVEEVRRCAPEHELHVVRTGGVEDASDVDRSMEAGVALNQWFTGYYEAFGHHGHDLYRELFRRVIRPG